MARFPAVPYRPVWQFGRYQIWQRAWLFADPAFPSCGARTHPAGPVTVVPTWQSDSSILATISDPFRVRRAA